MKRRIDKKYIWIPVCAMVIAVLSVCFFQYRIVQKAEEQAFDVLRDSAKEQRTILQTKIEGQYSITKAFASSLGTAAQMSSEDLLLRMNAVKESAGFTHIAVVGPDGTAYYGNGKRTDLSEKAFFATAMGGKDVLARDGTCLLGGDEGEFIMAVPVINGEEVRGVLVSHYKGEGFVKLLVSEAYGRRSFSFVSDSTGMVIIDNNKEGLSLEGENLLEEKYIDELNVSEKALSESLEIGSRGVFKATFGGVESYCIYEPLMINDWTIFNVVSEQVVKEKTSWFLNMAIGLCIIIFIASGIILLFLLWNEKVVKDKMEEQRISMMLSQIKPHFLYNTLSAIRGLIGDDPKQAQELVYHFSKYMRTNIDTLTSERLVTFEKELGHVIEYAEIEKIRFYGKIDVEYELDEIKFMIPPLTVQPIVENAIKHGIRKGEGEGIVDVCTSKDHKSYIVKVKDNGIGFDPQTLTDHEGSLGLANVKYRLDKMCNGTLEIDSSPGNGTVVTIRIPLKYKIEEEEL